MTSQSTGWRAKVSSALTGCTRTIWRSPSGRLWHYRMTLRSQFCMVLVSARGSISLGAIRSFPFWLRIPCYLAWNWGRLLRSLRGFVSRHLVASWLLGSSLTLLSLLWFMPSRSQLAHIENGVGLWARVFSKINLLYLVSAYIVFQTIRRRSR